MLVLAGELHDLDVVASAALAAYGERMPATLAASPGTRAWAALLLVTATQLTTLTWGEMPYRLGRLRGAPFTVEEGVEPFDIPSPLAFVSRWGAFAPDGDPRRWPRCGAGPEMGALDPARAGRPRRGHRARARGRRRGGAHRAPPTRTSARSAARALPRMRAFSLTARSTSPTGSDRRGRQPAAGLAGARPQGRGPPQRALPDTPEAPRPAPRAPPRRRVRAGPAGATPGASAGTSSQSPRSLIVAGRRTARTTVASSSTATASPTAISLSISAPSEAKMPNTATITTAALVTTPASSGSRARPRPRCSSLGRTASRIRLTMNTCSPSRARRGRRTGTAAARIDGPGRPEAEQRLEPAVLEHEHQTPYGRADGQEVQDDRLDRDDDRPERDEHS